MTWRVISSLDASLSVPPNSRDKAGPEFPSASASERIAAIGLFAVLPIPSGESRDQAGT
jgi:hypothetical protein